MAKKKRARASVSLRDRKRSINQIIDELVQSDSHEYASKKRKMITLTAKTLDQAEEIMRQPPHHLFDLPAELLNRIYRLAVVSEDGYVWHGGVNHQSPGVVRTCRRLRDEAGGIFYNENEFYVVITDLAFRVPEDNWIYTRIFGSHKFSFQYHGTANWTNLVAWIKQWHEKQLSCIGSPSNAPEEWAAAIRAFLIAEEMHELPWENVKNVLEQYRRAVPSKGASWHWTD